MTQAEIEALLGRGPEEEWTSLELKKSFAEKESAMRTLCAFLNGSGGTVLFGVTPLGKVSGMELTDENVRSLPDVFRFFEPAVAIAQERVALRNGKWVYMLRVEAGIPEQRPFQYQGRAYIRNANRTDVMPQSVFEEQLMRRGSAARRWEVQPASSHIRLADLDQTEIRRTVALGVAADRIPAESALDPVDVVLRNFHVLRSDGVLLNAAVALFGRPDVIEYPQCRLRLAHFLGIDKDSDLLDAPAAQTGAAFTLIASAEAFLRRRLPVAGRMVPRLFERQDDPVFPVRVLREALANAFAHRDYSQADGSVSVAIYANRIEIINPGSLPQGWTLSSLLKPHESKARNPIMAGVCYQRKLIDEWGRGTRSIYRLCVEASHPAPEFFLGPGTFGVRLNASISLSASRGLSPELMALSGGQIDVLLVLRLGPKSASGVVAALAGTKAEASVRNVRFFLQRLQAHAFVEAPARRGRGGEWFITERGHAALKAIAARGGRSEIGQ